MSMEKLTIDREMQPPPVVSFTNMNSLIYRDPAHQLVNLKPGDKNLQLKFIVLSIKETITTKKGERIYKFQVADGTACIDFNVFGESNIVVIAAGQYLKQGDICYVNGVYCSLYQGHMLLYQGKGLLRKIGVKYFPFDVRINMSEASHYPF